MRIAQKSRDATSAATGRSTIGSVLGYPKAFMFLFYICFEVPAIMCCCPLTPQKAAHMSCTQVSRVSFCDKASKCGDLCGLDYRTDLIFIFAKHHFTDSYCKM